MTLRDIAAADRSAILADRMGVGEAVVYLPVGGAITPIRGLWLEYPDDQRATHGVGVEARFSGATLDIKFSDAPALSRADRFQRVSTGATWEVEQIDVVTGVGYHIHLKQAGEALAKGLR